MLRGASPSVRTFVSPATPTTSQGGRLGSSSSRRRTRRPTASPFSQKRRAIASLTMTTGCVSGRSASLKLPPRTISMPTAPKNPGATSARSAMKAPWSGRRLEAGDVEVARAGAEGIQVQAADGADRVDAGQLTEAVEQAPGVDAHLVGRKRVGRRQEGQHGGRLASEARVDRLHLLEAAREDTGPDEQHQRDRELRDDQGGAPPELTGLAAPGVLAPEGTGHVRPGALQWCYHGILRWPRTSGHAWSGTLGDLESSGACDGLPRFWGQESFLDLEYGIKRLTVGVGPLCGRNPESSSCSGVCMRTESAVPCSVAFFLISALALSSSEVGVRDVRLRRLAVGPQPAPRSTPTRGPPRRLSEPPWSSGPSLLDLPVAVAGPSAAAPVDANEHGLPAQGAFRHKASMNEFEFQSLYQGCCRAPESDVFCTVIDGAHC